MGRASKKRARAYLEEAVAICLGLPRRREVSEALADLADDLAEIDPHRGREVARAIPHEAERERALEWIADLARVWDVTDLDERLAGLSELSRDDQELLADELVDAGRIEDALRVMEAREPLDFWPAWHVEDCCLAGFRKLLRHDASRTLALVDRLDPEANEVPLGLAAVVFWTRSPRKAKAYLDRIRDELTRLMTLDHLIYRLGPRRPEEAASLIAELPTRGELFDPLDHGRKWLRLGTPDGEGQALDVFRRIRGREVRARALAGAAGAMWTRRPRIARGVLREAEALLDEPRATRARDLVRRGLVDGFTDWPDDTIEEGVKRAERVAREIEAPLLRAECLQTIAAVFLP